MDLSKTLKSIRIEHGLTQKDLSERLRIGQATIACYENGQREPHIQNLIAYADYFECSLDYLLGRTDNFGNILIDAQESHRTRLTDDERTALVKYKALGLSDKARVQGYLDALLQKK